MQINEFKIKISGKANNFLKIPCVSQGGLLKGRTRIFDDIRIYFRGIFSFRWTVNERACTLPAVPSGSSLQVIYSIYISGIYLEIFVGKKKKKSWRTSLEGYLPASDLTKHFFLQVCMICPFYFFLSSNLTIHRHIFHQVGEILTIKEITTLPVR